MYTWCCTASATSPQSTVQIFTQWAMINTERSESVQLLPRPCDLICALKHVGCDLTAPNHHDPWQTNTITCKYLEHCAHWRRTSGTDWQLQGLHWHWLIEAPHSHRSRTHLYFSFSYDNMSSMAKATVWAPKQCSTMLQHPWNSSIFYTWSHATSQATAPAKHWMESHQCDGTWQINMQKQTVFHFSGKHSTINHTSCTPTDSVQKKVPPLHPGYLPPLASNCNCPGACYS